MNIFHGQKRGFTLIEILIVIAIIAILAAIVLVAVNPAKQLQDARNAQRRADINAILNAVTQYLVDNASLPPQIPGIDGSGATEIGGGAGRVALCTELRPTYIADLPVDPSNGTGDCSDEPNLSTRYSIVTSTSNRVTVNALDAEGTTISVTR